MSCSSSSCYTRAGTGASRPRRARRGTPEPAILTSLDTRSDRMPDLPYARTGVPRTFNPRFISSSASLISALPTFLDRVCCYVRLRQLSPDLISIILHMHLSYHLCPLSAPSRKANLSPYIQAEREGPGKICLKECGL